MKKLILSFVCAAFALSFVVTFSDAQGRLSPQGGTITSVTAGSGATGGGSGGPVTVNVGCGSGVTCSADAVAIDPTYTQRRISTDCGAGSAMRSVADDGTPTCISAGGSVDGSGSADLLTYWTDANTLGYTDDGAGSTCSWYGGLSCENGYFGATLSGYATTLYLLTLPADGESLAAGSNTLPGTNFTRVNVTPHASGSSIDKIGNGDTGVHLLVNASTTVPITLTNNASTTGSQKKIFCPNSADCIIPPYGSATLVITSGDTGYRVTNISTGLSSTGGLAYDTSGRQSLLRTCSADEVLKWSGSAWACASDDGAAADGVQIVSTSGTMDVSLSDSDVKVVIFTHLSSVTVRSINYCDEDNVGRELDLVSQSDADAPTVTRLTLAAYFYEDDGDLAASATARPGHVLHLRCVGPTDGESESEGLHGLYVWAVHEDTSGSGGVADGDYGDITVASSGTVWGIDSGAVDDTELADDLDLSGNGTLTLGGVGGTVQTSALTGNVDDFALNSTTTILLFSGAATLRGIAGGWGGRLLLVSFPGAASSILNESTAVSSAVNRLSLIGSSTLSTDQRSSVWLQYNGADSRWYVVNNNKLSTLTVAGAATVSSTLQVTGAITTSGALNAGNSNDDELNVRGVIKDTSTAPTVSSCGTSPGTPDGGSTRWRVVVGSGGVTACTFTFAADKGARSLCMAQVNNVSELVYVSSESDTAVTVTAKTGTTDLSGDTITVGCWGDD